MIKRRLHKIVEERLSQFPAVALLGPRQVGKTTLAHLIAENEASIYLDLENPADKEKLNDPKLYFSAHKGKLIILDEVHRVPDFFQILRGIIDEGKRNGEGHNRFLLLGSASIDLLRQTGESLAGRIAYVELDPFDILELEGEAEKLWERGGFPDSYLANNDHQSFVWRQNFIKTYLERDIPQLGPRIASETLRRFWTMLAHKQGSNLNASQLARNLAVDSKTISNYLDLFVDLLLVRKLSSFHKNISKRLVKAPKVYIRDSGILHSLLGIQNREQLYGNPIIGMSWEGFVINTLVNLLPDYIQAYFYRTQSGAEIDLILQFPDENIWAIEIKRSLSPRPEKGFYYAKEDLKPSRSYIVYPGEENYQIKEDINVINLRDLGKKILELL